MAGPTVLIFHRPPTAGDSPLVRLLGDARVALAERQVGLFERAGAGDVAINSAMAPSFGELLAATAPKSGGVVVLSAGAVPRLADRDAAQLVAVGNSGSRCALSNNRYSSDVCAIGDAAVLRDLPPLPSDNALPRWLEERAGFEVRELGSRDRLALDLDSPIDIALWTLASDSPRWPRELAAEVGLEVPRLDELRALAADPLRELLIFGRSGSSTLRWLERNVRCRVRFLSEERGLRASSPLAIAGQTKARPIRPPRATLGRLLDRWGPEGLADVVAELADGAIMDTRVLMADRFGADEDDWPAPADRYASDLHRGDQVTDPWLAALTQSVATTAIPIALGAHSLVGPGIPLLLKAPTGVADI